LEGYWTRPDEREWGWQAKFFLSPPDSSQWAQIDQSVKTTLEKHPRLSQYVVCLPIDRQDPRIEGIHLRRDKLSSIAYSEKLNSSTSSATLQSTDRRYGIVGQKYSDFQLDS